MSATQQSFPSPGRLTSPLRGSRRSRRSRDRVEAHAARAARAAGLDDPQGITITWPFVWWVLGRFVALGLLIATGWVVYDSASSNRFQVRHVRTTGNMLVTSAEVEETAAATGVNVFWINRFDVASRVAQLPAVQRVDVDPVLPDILEIKVVERQPTARWASAGRVYLVDSEGVVLAPAAGTKGDGLPATIDQGALPLVTQVGDETVGPGDRVDLHAIAATRQLEGLLASAGVQPIAFEWSRSGGLEVPTSEGWRVRFRGDASLDAQVSALVTIRDHLHQTRRAATLIDVRWAERPYFR